MGTITARKRKDSTVGYTAQVDGRRLQSLACGARGSSPEGPPPLSFTMDGQRQRTSANEAVPQAG